MAGMSLNLEPKRRRRASASPASSSEVSYDLELFDSFLEEPGESGQGFRSYVEIESVNDLRNAQEVLKRLKSIDWAFTHADMMYLSHDIHTYPAKFVPQIPGNLIANLSLRGEL